MKDPLEHTLCTPCILGVIFPNCWHIYSETKAIAVPSPLNQFTSTSAISNLATWKNRINWRRCTYFFLVENVEPQSFFFDGMILGVCTIRLAHGVESRISGDGLVIIFLIPVITPEKRTSYFLTVMFISSFDVFLIVLIDGYCRGYAVELEIWRYQVQFMAREEFLSQFFFNSW